MKKLLKITLILLLGLFFQSCYTLSGSSIDPSWQTIKIPTFPNYASYQNPNLSQQFTDELQDIFNNRTNLSLTNDDDADLLIEGEITNYQQSSVAIQANEIAGQNRLTVSVRVRYQNNKDESKSFDRSFSVRILTQLDSTTGRRRFTRKYFNKLPLKFSMQLLWIGNFN